MTDGFFTVLLIANCKAVRFLLDSKNCLLRYQAIYITRWYNAQALAKGFAGITLGVHTRDEVRVFKREISDSSLAGK